MAANKSTRKTEADGPDDWEYIWDAADKAHKMWPVGSVMAGLFGNWKVLILGVVAFMVMGGQELLESWGMWK